LVSEAGVFQIPNLHKAVTVVRNQLLTLSNNRYLLVFSATIFTIPAETLFLQFVLATRAGGTFPSLKCLKCTVGAIPPNAT
jgi:hypothetical protein